MVSSNRFGGNGDAGERGGRWQSLRRFRSPTLELATSVNDRTRGLSADIHRLPEARRQLIFRVRREIAEGTYDTDDKLEIALERMLDRHGGRDD